MGGCGGGVPAGAWLPVDKPKRAPVVGPPRGSGPVGGGTGRSAATWHPSVNTTGHRPPRGIAGWERRCACVRGGAAIPPSTRPVIGPLRGLAFRKGGVPAAGGAAILRERARSSIAPRGGTQRFLRNKRWLASPRRRGAAQAASSLQRRATTGAMVSQLKPRRASNCPMRSRNARSSRCASWCARLKAAR